MNTKQMKAALAKISPKSKVSSTEVTPFHQVVASAIGAVPSHTKGFFEAIGTSYQYHEAVRKGQL